MGPDVLESLSQHAGISRDELLSRLTREPKRPDCFSCGRLEPLGPGALAESESAGSFSKVLIEGTSCHDSRGYPHLYPH